MARPGHPVEVRQQAARLRADGVGRADIARRLGIGMSTVCRWFREDGVPFPVEYRGGTVARQQAVAERWAAEQREQDAHRAAVGALTERELFLVGAALYWAEGAKSKPWRRSHRFIFVNSDESIIRVFLSWLDLLGVPRSRLRCSVMIHESADVSSAEEYWRAVVGPEAVFNPAKIKRHRPATLRRNVNDGYHGCLAINVTEGAAVYRQTAGTWEGMTAAVASRCVDRSPVV